MACKKGSTISEGRTTITGKGKVDVDGQYDTGWNHALLEIEIFQGAIVVEHPRGNQKVQNSSALIFYTLCIGPIDWPEIAVNRKNARGFPY
jgi:hypothetical protein